MLKLTAQQEPVCVLWHHLECPLSCCCYCLQAMKDPHAYVRDTTAWTIARVFEFQHNAADPNIPELITRDTLPQVAQVRSMQAHASHTKQARHNPRSCTISMHGCMNHWHMVLAYTVVCTCLSPLSSACANICC